MNPEYIAEIHPDLFIAPYLKGQMSLTSIRAAAQKFKTRNAAWSAIKKLQRLNPGKFKRGWVALAENDRPQAAEEEV